MSIVKAVWSEWGCTSQDTTREAGMVAKGVIVMDSRVLLLQALWYLAMALTGHAVLAEAVHHMLHATPRSTAINASIMPLLVLTKHGHVDPRQ